MTEEKNEKWYKGWYLIVIAVVLGFVAWKLYPYVKATGFIKKMLKKVKK